MEKITTPLQNLAQLNEKLAELQPQYIEPINIQKVEKEKDMQVPLLKNNSSEDYIRWKKKIF